MKVLTNCPDCNVKPGKVHWIECYQERCSVCGERYLKCHCEGHDKKFARWTGIIPGKAEAEYLGLSLNDFYRQEWNKVFFIKPK